MNHIIGIGNALTDALVRLADDATLDRLELPKGSMQLIDEHQLPVIRTAMSALEVQKATGGSVGNSMLALANLGDQPGFIGKIGDDDFGRFFSSNAASHGIQTRLIVSPNMPSGVAHTFISPDGERTFATYLGAAGSLTADDLTDEMFAECNLFYIEGYLVQNHELVLRAAELARRHGARTALDLSSFNIVKSDHAFFEQLLHDSIDIVFANEEEARAYANCEPEEALKVLASVCELAIVKVGARGSMIMAGNERVSCPSIPVKNVVDTTGAGDFYAAGVLYGLEHGWSLERCAKAGTLLSSKVIQTVGTTLSEEVWVNIRKTMEKL